MPAAGWQGAPLGAAAASLTEGPARGSFSRLIIILPLVWYGQILGNGEVVVVNGVPDSLRMPPGTARQMGSRSRFEWVDSAHRWHTPQGI